jgi:hypothetical protein
MSPDFCKIDVPCKATRWTGGCDWRGLQGGEGPNSPNFVKASPEAGVSVENKKDVASSLIFLRFVRFSFLFW